MKFGISLALFVLAAPSAGFGQNYEQEMKALTEHPSLVNARRAIEALEPETQDVLIELTEIPAPPFGEEVRAARYAELLRQAGADSVYIDSIGNVIAVRRGTTSDGRTVAMGGHLDTVFPIETDVSVRISGDTLFAPGIGDDTRGLVVVLTVLKAMQRANIRTEANLLFIGTVGEEGLGDLRGMKHLFRDGGPRIDSWIAVDGGAVDRVLHAGLGSHRYRVTFKGPGGHSWGAFGLGNPAHALSRAVYFFDNAARDYVSTGARTSYNIGRIGGGTSVNAIPFESWMEVDMRSESPERLNGIDALLHAAVERSLTEQNGTRTRGEELTADVDLIGDRPSGTIPRETPLVQRAIAATEYLGSTPRFPTSSTDSNIPISMGIPSITIGRGGKGSGGHALTEFWINDNGAAAIEKALFIMTAEAGLAQIIP
jgi:tripeptide aminopeptidase